MAIITYLTTLHREASSLPRMNCLLGCRGTGLLLYTLGLFTTFSLVAPQGSFPKLENIGAHKSVNVEPPGATCGMPDRSAFCRPARIPEDLLTCSQRFCIQECPYRSSTPHPTDLLAAWLDGCPVGTSQDLHPGAVAGSASFAFRNQSGCLASPSALTLGPDSSFTLTVWLKLEEATVMTVFEKSSVDRLVVLLSVSEEKVQLQYGVQEGRRFTTTMSTAGRLTVGQWTHLALQVHNVTVSLFLNGQEEDSTALETQTLVSPVADVTSDSAVWIGQSSNGSWTFTGLMQDFRFYPQTLTNREIEEVYSGHLPRLYSQLACRCPPSHPRVHPLVERYCIPNGANDTTDSRVLRLNLDAHPLHYINDGDMGTTWVSSILSTQADMQQGVTITIDLENGEYQVFFVILQFRSAPAEAVRIQRKSGPTEAWSDWQFLARNCSFFGMVDNAPLDGPDSVNCLSFPSNVPYSRGNITFSMLTPEPNLRPGYNDFYNSAALQDFVRATHVRIHLQGQYHTQDASVPLRHRYYAVDEITISGRCHCHGHADACDTSINPYRCACLPESHTQGAQCERCAPLYNDKPFRAGEPVHAHACRPCQCHGHASSCHYEASVDPHPLEHLRGGGGVCDRCSHHTEGRNCELCESFYYRELGASPWAEDVCQPCECNSAGTVNSSLECDQTGGQCKCKPRVWGRRCDACAHGFYGLQGALSDGCRACSCHAAGTVMPDVPCHQDSGQCQCKANVIGLSCDRCRYGFKFLNQTNPDGCEPCRCSVEGALHQSCDPLTGQCQCRPGVRGLACDSCSPGSFGLTPGLCLPCHCSVEGSVPGSLCHPATGQCVCRPHVTGQRCNSCLAGYHSLGSGGKLGCVPCRCNPQGVAEGVVEACDRATGQCYCKSGVEGLHCERCSPHTYNLTTGNTTHRCQPCLCDPSSTTAGTVCDPDSGQCVCGPARTGQDCSSCAPGSFLSEQGSCEPCDCHPAGSAGPECAHDTGQCTCSHVLLAGRRCDRCRDLYYGFDPAIGRCELCDCDPAGTVNGSCLSETGLCVCKPFVTGVRCEWCVEGSSHMDISSILGCSKEPWQQPPPQGSVLSARAIALSWRAPDSPNSNALTYTLLRNLKRIHTSHSLHPFGVMLFTDVDLSPNTPYTYQLITSNVHGNTTSSSTTLRTLDAAPDPSELRLSLVGPAGPRSASLDWSMSQSSSTSVERYLLNSVDQQSGEERIRYEGLATAVTVDDLQPFTRYIFHLQACTSGGCAHGDTISVLTAQALPQHQAPPRVTTLGTTQLRVDWEPPAQPNGIIIRYELYMQILNASLDNATNPDSEQRVFVSSGWLNSQELIGSASGNTPTLPENSVVVSDLQPFTTYRYRVIAVNMAGSISSEWVMGQTAEEVPEYMDPPQVSPLSSSSLLVRWKAPRQQDVRGRVTEYRINLFQEQRSNSSTPPTVTQLLYRASVEERSYTVVGLKAYEQYSFTVTVCNAQGCVSSLPASGRTLPSAPSGLKVPTLRPLNMTTLEISWAPPAQLNAPPPVYHLERTDVSLSGVQGQVVRGRRFSGTGYFHFPSSTLPANADFTGLQLSFRTRAPDGLILCALSPGAQEEYVAVQLYSGRPYFLFDPQASAVAVGPHGDGGRKYNDDQWHRVVAARTRAVGTIIVDDQYSGSASATSGSTVIGQNTGVFLGGLPKNFTLHRQDTGAARLVRQGFAGCVRDILVQRASSPVAMWEPLDWDSALEQHETYGGWEGCPAHSEHGAYFLGHGFLTLKPEVFTGGDDFEISFEFRTDQLNALLLFAYDPQGDDYVLAELQGGLLSWALHWAGQSVELATWVGLSYCDGSWYSATMLKRGALTAAGLNEALEQQSSPRGGPLTITSPLYLGGVPPGLQHPALHQHSLLQGFGGCIRDVRLVARGPVVNLAAGCHGAVRVNLDGCPSADTNVNCRGNDSILVYAGRETSTLDLTLQPFTEYLYRVMASGTGGWTTGPWQRGRSRETIPQSVLPPSRVASVNGSSAEVSWEEPLGVRGVIERYVVKAYSRDGPSSPPISAAFAVTPPPLTGTLNGLAPFSSYSITLTACTPAGCSESTHAALLTTPQEAPDEVLPPRAVAFPHSLSVSWERPQSPNGVISHYTLYKNDTVIYQGNGTAFNITGLGVYTSHKLLLSACTGAGCTNSTAVTFVSGQLPPAHMEAPVLTVLDAHTIHVQWGAPLRPNGLLQFYTIYLALPGEEPVAVYNSTALSEEHILQNLIPGTTYLLQIAACTAGGCTLSSPGLARTEESSPEEVPAPSVLHVSPHTLHLSWEPPRKPNGVISSYSLWMDGALLQNSSATSFVANGLSPWSLHSFSVQACTAQGCALGPLTEVRTLEAGPLGSILLEVVAETPRSVRVKWDPPAAPNGNLTYSVLFVGAFHPPAGQNLTVPETSDLETSTPEISAPETSAPETSAPETSAPETSAPETSVLETSVPETRVQISTGMAGRWVSVGGLLPNSNYSVWVKACNSQGCVESAPVSLALPPAAPDGLLAPRLIVATSSSLQVAWSPPAWPNAPGPLRYTLQMRQPDTQHILQMVDSETIVFRHLVDGLEPYTDYEFRLLVSHSYGEASSAWVCLSTAPDRPGPVDPPMLFEIHSRNATISWSPPSRPNGILIHYNIYQNGQLSTSVPANNSSLTLSGLEPYQEYTFQVEACTEAGCTTSANSHTVRTPPAPPEGVGTPRLYSDTPTSVLVAWTPPLHPNGELESYKLERRPAGTQQISEVATVLPNQTLTYLDGSATLSPWTSYEYRVVANTRQGGSNSSQWEKVTTRPSRPARVLPPEVLVLGPESVQVTWAAPLDANGEIERYEIRMPAPRISPTNTTTLSHTVTGLVPYTNYSVTVLACSGGGGYVGGCNESPPTSVTTLPTIPQGVESLSVVAISESFLAVSWQPPARPNGPNIRYELLRRKTLQPLARRPPEDFNRWHRVYAGGKLLHEDKGLSRYTWYEYKLLVHNDVGYSSGGVTTGVTKAGLPLTPANVSTMTLNHTAIVVNWTMPTLQDLQGKVEIYFLTVNSTQESQTLSLDPSVTSAVISDLQPSTEYTFSLTVSNGAHNISSPVEMCTTAGSEPEGVIPPEVVILNSTSARVSWAAPLFPNGEVTRCSIYLDGLLYASSTSTSGSLELGGLLPFTVHDVQVEVCTVYGCVMSSSTKVTTVESTPALLAAPHVQVLSSSSVRLEWTSPGRPNGIVGGYEVRRKALKSCEETKQAVSPQTPCTYLQCPVYQDFCGDSCYDPERQVCCGGTVHDYKELHSCCGEQYLLVADAFTSVCCGGQFHQHLPLHQCCGGLYVAVSLGDVCCPDASQRRVAVGPGDACCGARPFSSAAGQVCCRGLLHDGYSTQCCGGRLVSGNAVCCGDASQGTAHEPTPGMACCGEQYINTSLWLCCGGPGPQARAHMLEDRGGAVTCCRSELIPLDQECCNGVGFSPHAATCADRAPHGVRIPEKCRPSVVCPAAAASKAFCGSCDFDPAVFTCTWVPTDQGELPAQPTLSNTTHGHLCPTADILVYSGPADTYMFTETDLEPFTHYEYRIGAWNRHGYVFSSSSWITTKEAVPQEVLPPSWSHVGVRDDVIQLDWSPPFKPNGDISHYVVLRDGQERYRGAVQSFTDAEGIRPSQEYTYQLRACNRAGCSDSPTVVAVTVQGVPEGVAAPVVSALGPTALRVSWVAPAKANGVVREYQLIQSGVGVIHAHGEMSHNITGLQPHTDYSFRIAACTTAGCRMSEPTVGRTLQDAPAGVWAVPRHVPLNSTAVQLFWSSPAEPNGLLAHYRLLRDGQLIFTGSPHVRCYVDGGLRPGTRYVYELEASTGGGSGRGDRYVIRTPVSSPEGIPAPHNVSVVGPRSVFVAWEPPGVYNSSVPVEYNVLLNAGTERPLVRPAGSDRFLLLDGLDPFTSYDVRVQACQAVGCGAGPGVSVQTPEAAPQALDPPTLRAAAAAVIEVHWNPPHKPNGLLTTYLIYRRPKGTQEELLVFIWTEGPLEFIDASESLQPFTEYEYRVTAHNSQGSTSSSWSSTLTLESEPEGMAPPTAWPTGPYSVLLNWTQPSKPNGKVSTYKVVYQKESIDPTLSSTMVTALTVPAAVLQAHVFGLEPYTSYSVRVEAVSGGGSAAGPWASVQTLQASPSGLGNFSVEKREHGRALFLQWPEPTSPNGVLKVYNVFSDGNLEFSGLSRQFLFRRLEPYTTYTLVLEACTEAGCTRTPAQPVTTGEAPPTSQPAPITHRLRSHDVELSWNPPAQPNGVLLHYQLLAAGVEDGGLGSDEDEETQAKVACTVSDVDNGSFSCHVFGLQPWSRYRFCVRVSNTAGSTDSPWLTVLTKQAPPKGLAPPAVSHLEGRPHELFVSWTPPLEANGVLLSYRIQRDNIGFGFSFDSSVLNYTDKELTAHTVYNYAVIACTVAGCVTSQPTVVSTLEAAPATVEPPVVSNVTSHSINVSWNVPTIQNGEILEYILQINKEEVYHGKKLSAQVSGLEPHTPYVLILIACTNGGCTSSTPTLSQTQEAPPTGMPVPTLKVTGPESVEVAWREPDCPNGVITGYELHRDEHVIYVGMDTRFHDFTLLSNVEYSYTVAASNSQGTVLSPPALARTWPSAPSGMTPPRLQALGPSSVMVQWESPVRANGILVSYSVYKRDPSEPNVSRLVFAPHHSAFQSRSFSLTALQPYCRYEVRVEACTLLGCASSEWASVQTPEAPPAGQSAPLLELQVDSLGMQTVFLLSWSPPAQANGKLLHYELYRRLSEDGEKRSAALLVYRDVATSYHDRGLLPYMPYEYQVWAVNSAGRVGSPWAVGRTGPAPPEGVAPLQFLRIHATWAVVDIRPPSKPNGIVSLYKVFAQTKETHMLLSEGTSRQQTLHGLAPFTAYSVGVEACTCPGCCSRGPLSELRTPPSAPDQQPPPRPAALAPRWALAKWDQPLQPNGVIESFELLLRSACPQTMQPLPVSCSLGQVESRFFGKDQSFNITSLLPYTTYDICVVSYNNMGSTASDWVSITTLKEPPQYKQAFAVHSNLTAVFVDWSLSFFLNGPLKEYALSESGLRVYSGFHSSVHIPRTSDKTFVFQVTCTTDSGSASSPVIKYSTASGVDVLESASGDTGGAYGTSTSFHTELWFILLTAVAGLVLLALLLGVVLRRALGKAPFVRERPPLQPLQRRSPTYPPSASYLRPCSDLCSSHVSTALLQSNGGMCDSMPDSDSTVILKRFTMHTEGLSDTKVGGSASCPSTSVPSVPRESQLGHAYSQHSLHRSVSQLINTQDSRSGTGTAWDQELQGTHAPVYVGDEELGETIKGFSSMKKEHTMFTDTHL